MFHKKVLQAKANSHLWWPPEIQWQGCMSLWVMTSFLNQRNDVLGDKFLAGCWTDKRMPCWSLAKFKLKNKQTHNCINSIVARNTRLCSSFEGCADFEIRSCLVKKKGARHVLGKTSLRNELLVLCAQIEEFYILLPILIRNHFLQQLFHIKCISCGYKTSWGFSQVSCKTPSCINSLLSLFSLHIASIIRCLCYTINSTHVSCVADSHLFSRNDTLLGSWLWCPAKPGE